MQEVPLISDREYIISLSGDIRNLSESIDRFSQVITKLEDQRITPMENDLQDLKEWRSEINGTWKAVGIVSVLLSIAATLKAFIH